MRNVTFTEFRKNASTFIFEVENGEAIQLIRYGKPVAEIIPVRDRDDHTPLWKKPGLRLTAKGAHLTEAILQERDNSST